MEQVLDLDKKTLAGFFSICWVFVRCLGDWMWHFGASLLGYSTIVQLMYKGWINFVFNLAEDVGEILALQWWLDSSILTLKVWTSLFNLATKKPNVNAMWVKFPRLWLEWWLKDCLLALGNSPRGFIVVLEEFKSSPKRTVAKFLINLCVQGGLYTSIDLICGNKCHT